MSPHIESALRESLRLRELLARRRIEPSAHDLGMIICRNDDLQVIYKCFLQWSSKVSECQCKLFVVGILWVTGGGVRNHIYDDSFICVHNFK